MRNPRSWNVTGETSCFISGAGFCLAPPYCGALHVAHPEEMRDSQVVRIAGNRTVRRGYQKLHADEARSLRVQVVHPAAGDGTPQNKAGLGVTGHNRRRRSGPSDLTGLGRRDWDGTGRNLDQ